METQETPVKQLAFLGNGSKLFSIYIVNLLLTAVTLGFYYPWAKASVLKYLYQETELEGSRFMFHGTGKEMFKGFIKAVAVFGVLYGILVAAQLSGDSSLILAGALVYLAGLLILIPLAVHGSMKYRMSRTSWRGIHFGYRGKLSDLMMLFIKGFVFTIFTFGIYGPWFTVSLRKYLIGNTRFGNVEFEYTGEGSDLLVLYISGYFLTIITLGIYSFWFAKDLINYFIDNIQLKQNGREIRLQSYLTGGTYFRLAIVNMFIIIFSLGLAAPWATVRAMRILLSNVFIEGELDLNDLEQTERPYTDATGEDVADMLDIGIM
ncbi:YjgN family protein [Pedobacter sp. SYSU D00535]|uniref:YjgN family protein n=1 Tax=Pedobacter sp. SYSU D00535 TaxID=2810308 RepID=UPI001A9747E4|nr:YjgN family protein [Pedobacter sp. SYSU D00535]